MRLACLALITSCLAASSALAQEFVAPPTLFVVPTDKVEEAGKRIAYISAFCARTNAMDYASCLKEHTRGLAIPVEPGSFRCSEVPLITMDSEGKPEPVLVDNKPKGSGVSWCVAALSQ